MAEERFLIKDPVHGSIELSGKYLRQIIDSKQFQRLRKIKQLGGASYVYPGATHTRFEHSIGVCYIASELIEYLKRHTPKDIFDFEKWTERDNPKFPGIPDIPDIIKCVKTAALCHDLGHGPFSHLYDFAVKSAVSSQNNDEPVLLKDHEYRSVEVFKKVCEERNLEFSCYEIDLVGKLITFSEDFKKYNDGNVEERLKLWLHNQPEDYNEIAFLFEIVANGITCVDVDKMDYFLRDGHSTGLTSVFDWRRFIQTLEIKHAYKLKDDTEPVAHINRLCSREKEARELYQLFHIRDQLFHQVYRHKTTIAVEYLLQKSFEEASSELFIIGREKKFNILTDAWKNMDVFNLLNDSLEDIILMPQNLVKLHNEDEVIKEQNEIGDNELKFCWIVDQGTADDSHGIVKAKKIITDIKERRIMKFIGEIEKNEDIDKSSLKRELAKLVDESAANTEEELKHELREKIPTIDLRSAAQKKKEEILEILKQEMMREVPDERVDGDSIVVLSAIFHYGMKKKNPIENYLFLRKGQNANPEYLPKEDVSKMLPDTFLEEKWMFYTDEHELLQMLRHKFQTIVKLSTQS